MTRRILCILAAASCLGCPGRLAGRTVAEKASRSYHLSSRNYGRAEYYSLRNDLNSYLIYLQWTLATAKSSEKVMIGLPEPCFWSGFINRDFMSVEVNGISSLDLEPKSISTFAENGCAGIDILYNFDGVRMTFRYFVEEDSPRLRFELRRDPDCGEPVGSAKVFVSVHPSFALPNAGARDARYQREILTPVRTIQSPGGTGTAWFSLTPADATLVMYDKGKTPEEVKDRKGPCLMDIDWNGIAAGRVWFGKIYCMSFQFTLDPKASVWRFAFLEFKRPIENQEFIARYHIPASGTAGSRK